MKLSNQQLTNEQLKHLSPAQQELLMRLSGKVVDARGASSLADAGERTGYGVRTAASSTRHPLSFAQERLWIVDRMDGASPVYNISHAWRFDHAVDEVALEGAFRDVVSRHDALRVRFVQTESGLQQEVTGTVPALETLDCPDQEPASARAFTERMLQERAVVPFDLTQPPFIRLTLIRQGSDRCMVLVVMHHIASDGWSLGVFARDLSLAYAARCTGRAPDFEPLPRGYTDFALWQRRTLSGAALESELAFWRAALEGVEPIDLPFDHLRPRTAAHRGESVHFVLAAPLKQALERFGRERRSTLFMVMLAALHTLLFRLGAAHDHVIGTPIAGRNRVEDEPLIGFFVNTLVMRTDLSGNPAFDEVLMRTRQRVFAAFEHQDMPFEKLVMELNPPRDPGRNPLFQVVLAMQNAPTVELDLDGPADERFRVSTGTAKFDLLFDLVPHADRIAGTLVHDADLFTPATAEQISRCFVALLEGIVQNPACTIGELPLLQADDLSRLQSWQGVRRDYDRMRRVEDFVSDHARDTPEAIALVQGDVALSYAELQRQVKAFAVRLQRSGVIRGTHVGILLERSTDLVIATLAILRVGGVFVPLDPDYPPSRLQFLVRDADIRVVVSSGTLTDALAGSVDTVVKVDQPVDGQDPAVHGSADISPFTSAGGSADDVCSVMYTSGSTGNPKGVRITHRNIVRVVHGVDYLPFGPARRTLLHSPHAFDASTFELFGALLHGGTCVIAPPGRDDIRMIGECIRRHGVDTLWLTSSVFTLVMEESPEILSGVRWLVTGGEALSTGSVRKALDLRESPQIINGYGPTETTTFACCYRVPRTLPERCRSIPIGRPLPNVFCCVVDGRGNAVPPGVAGELFIGGDGVAAGYLDRPELDAGRFVRLPVAGDQRLYRTGDRVRWLHDGTLEFLGRIDAQIKLNGLRIEPGEIEAALRSGGRVHDAAVLVREDQPGRRQLVGYVSGAGIDAESELARLRTMLPAFMVPSVLVVLEALPLTASGKLDRRALPAPASSRDAGPLAGAGPRNDAERLLVDIWKEVLGVPQVGIHDNFFSLGGHSLLASRAVLRTGRLFGVDLPLGVLFEASTIAELAPRIQQLGPARSLQRSQASTLSVIRPSASGDAVFCVGGRIADLLGSIPGQAGIVFLGSGGTDPVAFHRLGVQGAVRRHAEEIGKLIRSSAISPGGNAVIIGFSYAGLVAYALAAQLRRTTSLNVHAVLLEPSVISHSAARRSHSLRIKLRDAKRWVKLKLRGKPMRAADPDVAGLVRDPTEGEKAWEEIAPYLRRNIHRYKPDRMPQDGVHLIAGDAWLAGRFPHFSQHFVEGASVHNVGQAQHHDLVEDPVCINVWRQVIDECLRGV